MFRVPPSTTRHCSWIKASASVGTGACVEVTADLAEPGLRDSKHPEQFALLSPDVWHLLADARAGRLDLA